MKKDNPIVINEFYKGTSESPFLGNSAIVGCDILDEPGILKATNLPEVMSTLNASKGTPVSYSQSFDKTFHLVTTEYGRVNAFVNSITGSPLAYYDYGGCYDSLPIKIQYVNGSSSVIDGFIISGKNADGFLGFIRLPNSSSITTPVLQYTGLTTSNIQLLDGKDGYTYFTNGNKIGRFGSVTFDYGVGTFATTGFTANALDLPSDEIITCIRNFGNNIVVGTESGRLYFWDRVSASYTRPVEIFEKINALLYYNNRLYVSAGVRGNVYLSDGTNYTKIKTIPYSKYKKFSATSKVYPNAICINQAGNILIGTSTYFDGTPNTTTLHGVWEIGLTQGYPIHLAFMDAQNSKGQASPVRIGLVRAATSVGVSSDSSIQFGTETGSATTTCQYLGTTQRRSADYTSYLETQMFVVGSRESRRSFNSIYFLLARPLEPGQGIKVSYRKNIDAAYTPIGTFDYAKLGSVISHSDKALIADTEMVQIKIELQQGYSNTFYKDLSLLQVIIN